MSNEDRSTNQPDEENLSGTAETQETPGKTLPSGRWRTIPTPDDKGASAGAQDEHSQSQDVEGAGDSRGDSQKALEEQGGPSLVDELGVVDLRDPVVGGRGKLFSVAGRFAPVAEFTDEFLVLHPPQRPFEDAEESESEEIAIVMDESGVLVNEIGQRKHIPGARFNGHELFYFWQQQPGSLKHYAVWFDAAGEHHFLTIDGQRITTDIIYKLRNMTHDGELTKFTEIISE